MRIAGVISLLNDTASDLVYPLNYPLYLFSVLMAGPKALGIIEGIAEATSSLSGKPTIALVGCVSDSVTHPITAKGVLASA